MSGRPGDEEVLLVDAYLDELLATRERVRAVTVDGVDPLDPIAGAARAVRRALVRYHPSFRFEEELAGRLRAVATGASRGIPSPGQRRPLAIVAVGATPEADLPDRGAERGWVLIGGAIASGVSMAGAVLLAWRRARGDRREEPA